MDSSRLEPKQRVTLAYWIVPPGGRLRSGRPWSWLGFINSPRSNALASIIAVLRWRLWRALARRYAWGISNGGLARRVLSWLLLGTVRRTRCCRNHELDLDAGLTLVVFAEKVFPHGHRVSAIIGFTLLALGLMVGGSIL